MEFKKGRKDNQIQVTQCFVLFAKNVQYNAVSQWKKCYHLPVHVYCMSSQLKQGFFSMVYQYKTSSDEDHIIFLLSVFPFLNQHKKKIQT